MTDALLTYSLVETLGRVLLHFLWQGALVAGALALALRLMRRRPAEERYAAALAALVLMVALPPATWWALPAATPPASSADPAAKAEKARVRVFAAPAAPEPAVTPGFTGHFFQRPTRDARSRAESEVSDVGWREAIVARAGRWSGAATAATAPWMALGWLLGVAVLALRMAGGWLGTRRLRRQATPVEDGRWTRRFTSLARQMGLGRVPRLLRSSRIDGPATVGWWRPVVLVPAGFLAGLPPAQVEAILRHELAHIRRYDYLAALAQAAVETLLFYHPAVWWVSGRVRTLREHCCDERAARRAESRLTYARALTELEGRRTAAGFALSAAEGDLFERVRRVVQEPAASRPGRLAPALAALLLLAAVAVAACAPRAVSAENEPASSLATPSDTTAAAVPEAPAPPSAVPSPPPPPAPPAPPPDTTTHVRIFSDDPDVTTGVRIAVVHGDTVDIDSLNATAPDFDSEAWQQWGEQMEDWGERFGRQWAADSSQWNAWAKRVEDWGDGLSVAFSSDSSVVVRSLPSFPDSFDVRVPDLPALDSLPMKVLSVDSVLASAPASRLDTLPRVPSVSVVAPHADRRERQALRRTARRLDERAEALDAQGQEDAADALRDEAERLREEAEQTRNEYRRRMKKHRERLRRHRERLEKRQEQRLREEARGHVREQLRAQADGTGTARLHLKDPVVRIDGQPLSFSSGLSVWGEETLSFYHPDHGLFIFSDRRFESSVRAGRVEGRTARFSVNGKKVTVQSRANRPIVRGGGRSLYVYHDPDYASEVEQGDGEVYRGAWVGAGHLPGALEEGARAFRSYDSDDEMQDIE